MKIPSDPRFLARAAENLLGRSDEEVRALVRQTVEAAVPAVLARLSDPAPDWERTGAAVEASVGPDLAAYGLIVATLSIVELRRWSPESAAARSLSPSATSSRSADSTRLRAASSSSLDDRLFRVEESLGVIGAEVVRLARDSSGWETTELGSVFDVPLGAEIPATPARPALGGGFVHDSEGATRRVRAPVLSTDEGPEATDGDRFLDAPKTER